MSSVVDDVLSRYRPSALVYKAGEKVPVSGTYTCYRGTMVPPARIQAIRVRGPQRPRASAPR